MSTLGHGTTISSKRLGQIGSVQSVGFSLSTDNADTTSTASKYAAYVPTSIKANTIFISFLTGASDVTSFVNEFKSKQTDTWTISFSDSGSFSATGYVAGVTVASPYDNIVRCDIIIELTGEPRYT